MSYLRLPARIVASLILTPRGFFIALAGFLALRLIAFPENDLFLSVVGGAALALPIFVALITFFQARRLKKQLTVTAKFDHSGVNTGINGGIVANRDVPSGLILHQSSLLPLFELKIQRVFDHRGVASPLHVVRGREDYVRYLIDSVNFPHRGIWRLTSVKVTVGDRFGLSRSLFELPVQQELEVFAPIQPIRPLPIVAASAKAGDLIEHVRERTGDPFDMKAYDPSDGVSRIFWKTFAKSGQLVVRRPEASVIPEGEVAVYVVAGKEDDHVEGAFASYLEQLRNNSIACLFGTDGTNQLLVSDGQIFRALHEAVWNSKAGSGSDIPAYLDLLINSGRLITQVIIFAPEQYGDWYAIAQEATSRRGVRLTLAVVPDNFVFKPPAETGLFTFLKRTKSQGNRPLWTPGSVEILRCERSELPSYGYQAIN